MSKPWGRSFKRNVNVAVTFFRLTNWRTRRSRKCTQRSTNSERSAISWTLKACFAMNTWREWSSVHHSCLKKSRMDSCRAQRNSVIACQRLMLSAQGFENRSSFCFLTSWYFCCSCFVSEPYLYLAGFYLSTTLATSNCSPRYLCVTSSGI